MNLNNSMAVYAFRYCLGRETYAVSDCVEWLIANWDSLTKSSQNLMIHEIKEAFIHKRLSRLGESQWRQLLDAVEKKEDSCSVT